jgi:hypothetical protein
MILRSSTRLRKSVSSRLFVLAADICGASSKVRVLPPGLRKKGLAWQDLPSSSGRSNQGRPSLTFKLSRLPPPSVVAALAMSCCDASRDLRRPRVRPRFGFTWTRRMTRLSACTARMATTWRDGRRITMAVAARLKSTASPSLRDEARNYSHRRIESAIGLERPDRIGSSWCLRGAPTLPQFVRGLRTPDECSNVIVELLAARIGVITTGPASVARRYRS